MRMWKKLVSAALTAVLTFGMTGIISQAADKKITSVSLTITSDIKVGDDMDNDSIEVDCESSRYWVDSCEIQNAGFEWMEDDVPQIKVELAAADGYYFSLTSSKVRLKGAEYVTASKRDSSTILSITMNLPSLAETVGEIEHVTLGEDGIAYWDPVIGAGSYEVRLRRDGKNTGAAVNVTNASCNFRERMVKPGTYSVRVRPINRVKSDIKGDWTESQSLYVDSNLATAFRTGQVQNGGKWEEDGSGWKYREIDGTYPRSDWKQIGGQWYYFDYNGYAITQDWLELDGKWYYFDASGAMMHDTQVDGYSLGSDGAMITG